MPSMSEILLIEDTETDAILLERTLRSAGVTNPISRARTGTEALLFLNANERAAGKDGKAPLGIAFIDLKLPDKSGFELLKVLHERKSFSNTLKVVVSQLEDMANIRTAYKAGADSFISKPAGQQDVMELIRAFPENWSLQDGRSARALSDGDRRSSPEVWAEHRQLIDTLRRAVERLRSRFADNEETFAILDTIKEELRGKYGPGAKPAAQKKKPKENLL
jgi:CheY-like chemotaxis protein